MQTLTLPQHYHGRRFYSLDAYLKNTFGEKLYKLSLSGGMTCPNRDGTIAFGGCIFCSEGGSGDFAADSSLPVSEQIESAKKTVGRKFDGNRYIAYFQSFTNTYQSVSYLERLFFPVIEREEIACLSIATRPDCLEEDKLRLLQRLNRIKPVWVELGLQTIHPETAALIRRGYPLNTYDTAVKHLKEIGRPHDLRTSAGEKKRYARNRRLYRQKRRSRHQAAIASCTQEYHSCRDVPKPAVFRLDRG